MDDELVKKVCDAVKESAEANGIGDSQLHAIVDAIAKEVKRNLCEYVDIVCQKWI